MINPFKGVSAASAQKKHDQLVNSLIHYEAKLGGDLFGPVGSGHKRQFFCLDEHTWVWHEEWTDANSKRHAKTTRYIVRPRQGVVKTSGDGNYQRLTAPEARNLYQAVEAYQKKVNAAYDKLLTPAR